mmetsp:Transcript_7583/g.12701  ORF Transcript_7583/g.12701 Transcript_7583/m.12701 type:complete len:305 (+) Transcript_7583:519-1433(+)
MREGVRGGSLWGREETVTFDGRDRGPRQGEAVRSRRARGVDERVAHHVVGRDVEVEAVALSLTVVEAVGRLGVLVVTVGGRRAAVETERDRAEGKSETLVSLIGSFVADLTTIVVVVGGAVRVTVEVVRGGVLGEGSEDTTFARGGRGGDLLAEVLVLAGLGADEVGVGRGVTRESPGALPDVELGVVEVDDVAFLCLLSAEAETRDGLLDGDELGGRSQLSVDGLELVVLGGELLHVELFAIGQPELVATDEDVGLGHKGSRRRGLREDHSCLLCVFVMGDGDDGSCFLVEERVVGGGEGSGL